MLTCVLRDLLPDWEDEARQDLIQGKAGSMLRTFGVEVLSARIQVHEGSAKGGPSSWDLPIVEEV